MSTTILALAKLFQSGRLSADEFSNTYMELWKFEGKEGILSNDDDLLSECLSSIFCLADLYNSSITRKNFELNEAQLRERITGLLQTLNE